MVQRDIVRCPTVWPYLELGIQQAGFWAMKTGSVQNIQVGGS